MIFVQYIKEPIAILAISSNYWPVPNYPQMGKKGLSLKYEECPQNDNFYCNADN